MSKSHMEMDIYFRSQFTHVIVTLTLLWGGYFDLVFGGGGGKITSPILTAVLVVQLSSNLVRMSNWQIVLNFWKKNQNL